MNALHFFATSAVIADALVCGSAHESQVKARNGVTIFDLICTELSPGSDHKRSFTGAASGPTLIPGGDFDEPVTLLLGKAKQKRMIDPDYGFRII